MLYDAQYAKASEFINIQRPKIDKSKDNFFMINLFFVVGTKDKDYSDLWLMERIMVFDGGGYYWNVKFNLDKNELFELGINGYA